MTSQPSLCWCWFQAVFVVSDYMSNQTEVTATMRAILVDWMSEVQQNFELNHETLYLAVKLIDIYLAKTNIVKDQLQLLGATALSIASKFEVCSSGVSLLLCKVSCLSRTLQECF